MAANSRVFIAYRQLLLARAIEGALRAENDIEVIACERIESDLPELIRVLNPEVLIVDRLDLVGESDLVVPDVCRDNPGLKVIVIDHGANTVEVYRMDHNQVVVSDPLDIVGIIRSSIY